MPRHLYAKWSAGILLAAVFFGLAMVEAVASVSPLRFDEEGLPFVWDQDNPFATLLPLGLCFVAGLILPMWFEAGGGAPGVVRAVVTAAITGVALAAAVCFVLSLCIQTHVGSCLLWLLGFGFMTWRTRQSGVRSR